MGSTRHYYYHQRSCRILQCTTTTNVVVASYNTMRHNLLLQYISKGYEAIYRTHRYLDPPRFIAEGFYCTRLDITTIYDGIGYRTEAYTFYSHTVYGLILFGSWADADFRLYAISTCNNTPTGSLNHHQHCRGVYRKKKTLT